VFPTPPHSSPLSLTSLPHLSPSPLSLASFPHLSPSPHTNTRRRTSVRAGADLAQQSVAVKLFDEAAVIVWACGYGTNICPVYDVDGTTPIPLCMYRGQVEVDDRARILTPKRLQPPAAWGDQTATNGGSSGSGSPVSSPLRAIPAPASPTKPSAAVGAVIVNAAAVDEPCEEAKIGPVLAAPVPCASPVRPGVTRTKSTPALATSTTSAASATAPTASTTTAPTGGTEGAPAPVGGLLGSGLGFGLKATLDNGEADGSSGRADGVAVYLKHGATLVLAQVALLHRARG